MPPVDFLTKVRNTLPANQAQLLVSRLRTDPIIWSSLQDEAFADLVMDYAGDQLSRWSPANLMRLAVGEGWADPARWTLKSSEAKLAEQLFNESIHDHRMAVNLQEAGYLAVSLLEHWQANNNLLGLIETNAGEPEGRLLAIWKTPLTCIYGMLADPVILLRALLPKKIDPLSMAWISHCILSNPIEMMNQVQILTNLMVGISPAQQINWLRHFQLQGYPDLVSALAKSILTKTPIINTASLAKHMPEKSDLEINVVRLVELLRLVGLYRYSNQMANARAMAQKASQTLAHINSRLMLQVADLDLVDGKVDAAIEHYLRVMEATPASKEYPTETLMAISGCGPVEPILNNISAENWTPLVRIYRAKDQFDQGSHAQAREAATTATSQFMDQLSAQPVGVSTQFLPDWQPVHLVRTLMQMNLTEEALSVAEKLLETRPTDLALLGIAAEISSRQLNHLKALEFTTVMLMLEPANIDRRRQSAQLLEKMERWQEAKAELTQVVEISEPHREDWNALGRCSLHLQEWDAVIDFSDKVLDAEPENGKACALKGQALMALGKQQEAVQLLNQATLLAPEEAEPWLALARMQEESGENQRSMDTMKAAVLAVPESAEINFGLAKAYLRGGLYSDGLPFLRKAAVLAPESVDVTLDLGRTLMTLGHHEEAKKVLSQGRVRWPSHAVLAYTQAELLLSNEDREGALKALDMALQSSDDHPEWFLMAAKILTRFDESGSRLEQDTGRLITVQLGLERIITQQPDNLEARLLCAELLVARKENTKANDHFQKMIDASAVQPSYHWRIQAGIGETSLAMGVLENALVSIKDAVQSQPENPRLHRLLAEVFVAGDLNQDAANSARDAMKLVPDGLGMLTWYAGFMAKLGEVNEAIQALLTATQLAPDQGQYWVMLAEMQLRQEKQLEAVSALQTALGLPGLEKSLLRRIARAFITLNQPLVALEAMQLIRKDAVDPESQVELAYLYSLNKNYEQANEVLQQAINRMPNVSWLVIFQADILMKLGRFEAAAVCLEQVRKMLDAHPSRPASQSIRTSLIPEGWQAEIQQPYAVNLRYALLERQDGNLESALQYAEAAVKIRPEQVELHALAADLADAMLLKARAAHMAEMPILHQSLAPLPSGVSPVAITGLLCQQADCAVETGDLESAVIYTQKAEDIDAGNAQVLAMKTRLAVMGGDWKSALKFYAQMIKQAQFQSTREGQTQGICGTFPPPAYWQAQAALDVMDWNSAMTFQAKLLKEYPKEPRTLLGWIKTTIAAVEAIRTCKELQIVTHMPNPTYQSVEQFEQLEAVLDALEKVTNPLLVEPWRVRGKNAFRPTNQSLHALAETLPGEDSAAALMAALRATSNLSGAIQVAQEYPNSVKVLVQLALCHLNADLTESLKAANRAAELDGNNPTVQAVLAMALQKNGYMSEALEAWEAALESWGDEPFWFGKAGSLASEIGDIPASIEHWERAAALDPSNLDFVAELSKVYMEDGQHSKALDRLVDATHANENRADLWYLLAQANRYGKRLQEALECCEKASILDRAAVQPLLLSGEITLQMGNPDLAMSFARKALETQPSNEAAILFLVKVNETINRPEEGLALLEKSITPDSSVNMVLSYARLVYKQRGAQAALPMLKKITETDPDEVGVLKLLAHAQEECGEMAGAQQTAFQALQLEPNQPDLNSLMGRLKRLDGQLDQSVHYLSEAIRQEPTNINAYLELGKTYQDRREMVQALHTYEKAIQAESSDHRPYYMAGIVLRESKDYRGAENMLRRAAELAPQDVNIRRLLGAVITLNLIHSSQEVGTVHELQ